MPDVFSKTKRSEVMSNIRGKGNKSTEVRLLTLFKKNGIKGWRRHQPLPGKPDFIFPREQLAVFVDGCFWHGCPRCYIKPKQNAEFWEKKIGGNIKRDKKVSRNLRTSGWSVIRIWECKLKTPKAAINRIKKFLSN